MQNLHFCQRSAKVKVQSTTLHIPILFLPIFWPIRAACAGRNWHRHAWMDYTEMKRKSISEMRHNTSEVQTTSGLQIDCSWALGRSKCVPMCHPQLCCLVFCTFLQHRAWVLGTRCPLCVAVYLFLVCLMFLNICPTSC